LPKSGVPRPGLALDSCIEQYDRIHLTSAQSTVDLAYRTKRIRKLMTMETNNEKVYENEKFEKSSPISHG